MIKGSILQEDITTLHNYVPKSRVTKYERQKLIKAKGKRDKYFFIVGDVNTYLSITDRSSRQKISKNVFDLKSTVNQLNLTDIYRILSSTTAYYTYSQAHMEHS